MAATDDTCLRRALALSFVTAEDDAAGEKINGDIFLLLLLPPPPPTFPSASTSVASSSSSRDRPADPEEKQQAAWPMWMKRRKKSDRKPRSIELPLPAISDL